MDDSTRPDDAATLANETAPEPGPHEATIADGPDPSIITQADSPVRAGRAFPTVPGYEIRGELGRGGMGVVYLARQVLLNRPCALKMILAGIHADALSALRFLSEAESIARLRHPNVVQIHHIGQVDGLAFLELEYVEGGSLDQRLDGTPWPARKAAELVEALARGVAAAHEIGMVHRDLKPANVLIADGETPKVTDFGLAKVIDSGGGLTQTESILGSPGYMAPEQAGGHSREAGPPADVHALGAIFYELLVGRPPYRAASLLETLEQIRTAEPVPPTRLVRDIPRDLETVALKCLQKDPARRYPDAGALADDLRAFLDGRPIQARPTGPVERLARWTRRNRAVAALSAAVLGLLTAVAVVATVAYVRTASALDNEAAAKRLATASEGEMRRERDNARRVLYHSLVGEAAATNQARSVGYREQVFDLLRQAGRLDTPDRDPAELRREGARALGDFVGHSPRIFEEPILSLIRGQNGKFDPRTGHLAVGGADGAVHFVDLDARREVGRLPVGKGPIASIRFGLEGAMMSVSSRGDPLRIYRRGPGDAPWVQDRDHGTDATYLTRDGRILAIDSGSRPWVIRDLERGTTVEVDPLAGRDGADRASVQIGMIDLSFDARYLAAGLAVTIQGVMVRELVLFDLGSKSLVARQVVPFLNFGSPTFSPDGSFFAAGGDGGFAVYHTADGRMLMSDSGDSAASLRFSPDGRTMAVGLLSEGIKLWSTTARREMARLRLPRGVGNFVLFSPDGRRLVASNSAMAGYWELAGAGERLELAGHRGGVTAVAFSPDGRTLASTGKDGTASLWEPSSGRFRRALAGVNPDNQACTFSGDGQILAFGSHLGRRRLRLIRLDRPEEPLDLPFAAIHFLTPGPGARRFGVSSSGGFEILEVGDDRDASPDRPAGRSTTLLGGNAEAYDAWLGRLRDWGFRPRTVRVHDAGGAPRFVAIAEEDREPAVRYARRDRGIDGFRASFDRLITGRSLLSLCGARIGVATEFYSLWTTNASELGEIKECEYEISDGDLPSLLDRERLQGKRPVDLSAYADGDVTRWSTLWARGDGSVWSLHRLLDGGALRDLLERARTEGSRPTAAAAYPTGDGVRFAVVLSKGGPASEWSARLDLSADDYRREDDARRAEGLEPRVVAGYRLGEEDRYLGVWVRVPAPGGAAPAPAPVRGPTSVLGRFGVESYSNAISPDGRYAAYTRGLKDFSVLDLESGRDQPYSGPGLLHGWQALAFRSPRELVFVAKDGVLTVWDVAADRVVRRIGRPGDFAGYHVAVSRDGRWVATQPTATTVGLVDLERGEVAWTSRDERSSVYSFAFSPDGDRLAVGLSDGGLVLWDLPRVRQILDGLTAGR